jgi:hypothetical protein
MDEAMTEFGPAKQMYEKTESEEVFERYLEGQQLTWTRLSDPERKYPDYKVQHREMACLFEVKEFDEPAVQPSGGFSPCPAIQKKIRRARKQFKHFKDDCCAVVLWNSKSIYRSLLLDAVAPAALGEYVRRDATASSNRHAEPPRYQFSGSAALTPKHNTTISAITILAPYRLNHLWLEAWRILDTRRQRGDEITPWDQFGLLQELSSDHPATFSYEGTIRAVVLENPHARITFPPDLFVGQFDQRWRRESGWFSLAFIGAELAQLKQSRVPFIYL